MKKNPDKYTERDIEKAVLDEATRQHALEAMDLWRINKRREATKMMYEAAVHAREIEDPSFYVLRTLADDMNLKSGSLARLFTNPTQQEHKRFAMRGRKDVAKGVERMVEAYAAHRARPQARGVKQLAFLTATNVVVEGTRMFWNAYDAKDNGLAHEAAAAVLTAKNILADMAGVSPPDRPMFEGGNAARTAFGVSVPNPYRGDAVSAAKQRKYGYPKPPKDKAKKNPRGRMTKAEFAAMFRENMLPMIIAEYEQDGVPDKPARREAWNNTVDAYIRDGLLPKSAGNWTHPSWLETAKKNPRHTAERAAKRDKHKRKKGKKGSMSPYARKRAGGGARKNPGKKKNLAAIMREL